MSNEDIRQRAAIAVLPECVRETHEVLSNGGKLTEETQAKQAAMMAVAYADELAEKLSSVEQNGKDCKPANFAQSSKDLQEPKQEHKFKVGDRVLYFGNTYKILSVEDDGYVNDHQGFIPKTMEDAMSLIEEPEQELTEFEMALQATIIGFVLPKKKPSVEDVKYWAKKLMDIAYKQFERAQLNPKLEEYEQLFQHFNAAVNEEIKRRCDAIDAKEMADKYNTVFPHIYNGNACMEWYKKGLEDTIKKLKGE